MFGIFSLPKILFTIAAVAAIWYGFKWMNRRAQVRQRQAEQPRAKAPEANAQPEVEEMVQCPDCGAYVAKGSGHRCT